MLVNQRMSGHSISGIAGLAALIMSAQASAGSLAAVPMTMTPIYMNTTIGLLGIDAARRSIRHSGSASTDVESRPRSPPAGPVSYEVGTDTTVSGQVKNQFVQTIHGKPGEQSVLAFFERKPVRQAYLEICRPYGLGQADLRDVTAAYLVAGWMLAHPEMTGLPSTAQVQGVRQQVAAAMQASPPARTAIQRQTAAEQMMYELVSMIAARTEGVQTHNSAGLAEAASAVVSAFSRRGINLRDVKMTNLGFEQI